MRKVLYYPGFSVKDPNWLKFALLYFDELHSIVPDSAENFLPKHYCRIMNETDLIQLYQPKYGEAVKATELTIETLSKILSRPEFYKSWFSKQNFLASWRNKENQKHTIFREKYTEAFEEFCLSQGFGHAESSFGLKVSKELAMIYMSFLAHLIAQKHDLSEVTDQAKFDRISGITPSPRNDGLFDKKEYLAKTVVNLALPANIHEVSFEEIVKLRNNDTFRSNRKAFAKAIESYFNSLTTDPTSEAFLGTLNATLSDLVRDITKTFPHTLTFHVGVSYFVPGDLEAMYKLGITGLKIAIDSFWAIEKHFSQNGDKRKCLRYLADLSNL